MLWEDSWLGDQPLATNPPGYFTFCLGTTPLFVIYVQILLIGLKTTCISPQPNTRIQSLEPSSLYTYEPFLTTSEKTLSPRTYLLPKYFRKRKFYKRSRYLHGQSFIAGSIQMKCYKSINLTDIFRHLLYVLQRRGEKFTFFPHCAIGCKFFTEMVHLVGLRWATPTIKSFLSPLIHRKWMRKGEKPL